MVEKLANPDEEIAGEIPRGGEKIMGMFRPRSVGDVDWAKVGWRSRIAPRE